MAPFLKFRAESSSVLNQMVRGSFVKTAPRVPIAANAHPAVTARSKMAEQCDDGNTAGGDGCSARCIDEISDCHLGVNFDSDADYIFWVTRLNFSLC